MNGKALKHQLGPLRLRREIPDTISPKDEQGLQQLFDAANRSLDRASTGDSLREYIGRVEKLARGIFKTAGMDPDPVVTRCAQLVSEYEDPSTTGQPAHASTISDFVYGAARVLLRVNMLKFTMAQQTINPWILAGDCMRVEEAHQQLINAGAFAREGGTKTARQSREKEAKRRQDRMREWIGEHNGKYPSNDKATRAILEYKNPDKESARRQFSRDLNAVYATYEWRK